MFKEMKSWPWTDRAREIWWMAKFMFWGILFVGLLLLADWWARNA